MPHRPGNYVDGMATGEDATTWGEPQTVAGTLLMAQKAFEKAPPRSRVASQVA